MDRTGRRPHLCDAERILDFSMFALEHEITRFERALADYLASPAGVFEAWLAARDVRGTPS